ncbi:hypothetical protein RRSWK_02649 [Rhodopirellula sp. SWK7]|nr:hypothetical protein RRSWK_02649 [Rhodopirellula sp. SWK7]
MRRDEGSLKSLLSGTQELATVAVPRAMGQEAIAKRLRVYNGQGVCVTSQSEVVLRWSDRSERSVIVRFIADRDDDYTIVLPPFANSVKEVSAKCESSQISAELGRSGPHGRAIEFAFGNQSEAIVSLSLPTLIDGSCAFANLPDIQFVTDGPVCQFWELPITFCRSVDDNSSSAQSDRLALIDARLRVCCVPALGMIDLELTVTNHNPAGHPGGTWSLGSSGSVQIDKFAPTFDLSFANRDSFDGQLAQLILLDDTGTTNLTDRHSILVQQLSSGGRNWDCSNHALANGHVSLGGQGFSVMSGAGDFQSLHEKFGRAIPILEIAAEKQIAALTVKDFWQNYPSQIYGEKDQLLADFFPGDIAGAIELQGGEQKTFQFAFEFRKADQHSNLPAWVHSTVWTLDNQQLSMSGSITQLSSSSNAIDLLSDKYDSLCKLAIEGDNSFWNKCEHIDQFGWRNYGDLYGDHEAVYHRGNSPLISHYNNQYDCTLGFAIQFLRSGDRRWWDWAVRSADHAWDIDTYHTNQDKLLYNGGLFWHTYHYADAHTATHRSYPNRISSSTFDDGVDLKTLGETGKKLAKNYAVGGGPAASHNYPTGWMVLYSLTGRKIYRDAAVNAAEYVLRIDDGTKTPFRLLCQSDTGYSTNSGDGYFGPGRASANSTHALICGYELTLDLKYLDRAAVLMRRTVHPAQDLDALDLLNAELRWFYTMYLQALGRFLDLKMTTMSLDADFHYGVACLRHYARWMVTNERPTLSEPDNLQYPTETWAAQDMRKWHVLEHAARYECDAQWKAKMSDKAEFFFKYVVDYLTESPTKSLTRPVILLMNFGWQRSWYLQHRDRPAFREPISEDFGLPTQFIPQRQIAVQRAKVLILLFAMAVLFTVFAGLWWALSRGL